MTAAFTAGYEAGKTEGYDKGFAEGVDWATPRIWNEAIEAAAELVQAEEVLNGMPQGAAMVAAIRNRTHRIAAIRKLLKP